ASISSACCSPWRSVPLASARSAAISSAGAAGCRASRESRSVASDIKKLLPGQRPQVSERVVVLWGLAAGFPGAAEQLRGEIDDRDHPLVGDAGRADDAEHAHGVVVGRVRGGDDAALLEHLVAGLMADEDLHAFGVQALIEQAQHVVLLAERIKQRLQLV